MDNNPEAWEILAWPLETGRIYPGRAQDLGRLFPDESVDLVFTDPVYEDLEAYGWLSYWAGRVLRPGGSLITFCSIGLLPETLAALAAGGMRYRWELTSAWNGGAGRAPVGFCKQARALWYDRDGTATVRHKIVDLLVGVNGQSRLPVQFPDTGWPGSWTKIPDHVAYFLGAFAGPGDLVIDPFAGWGTVPAVAQLLGVEWIGFEMDPHRAHQAEIRAWSAQPLVTPHQLHLALEP